MMDDHWHKLQFPYGRPHVHDLDRGDLQLAAMQRLAGRHDRQAQQDAAVNDAIRSKLRVLLEVRRLEVVGPQHPQVVLDQLGALLLDDQRPA